MTNPNTNPNDTFDAISRLAQLYCLDFNERHVATLVVDLIAGGFEVVDIGLGAKEWNRVLSDVCIAESVRLEELEIKRVVVVITLTLLEII